MKFRNRFLLAATFSAALFLAYSLLVSAAMSDDTIVLELRHPEPSTMYDKTTVTKALLEGKLLSYGADLSSPNSASAVSLIQSRGLSLIFLDADRLSAPQVTELASAVQRSPALIVGRFRSASDPYLKPKLDAGLHGAILDNAPNLKETLRFLRRLYFAPLGQRPGGPAAASGFLSQFGTMVARANDVIVGGVSIGSGEGVERIESIVLAKKRGLRLIRVDSKSIAQSLGTTEGSDAHRAAVARVEKAALAAGIALATEARTVEEAKALYAKGYRHVVIGDDRSSVVQAFERFADLPRDSKREPAPREGQNDVASWLKEGKLVHVGFLMTPDLELARLLAERTNALWIDAEHGPFTLKSIRTVIQAVPRETNVFVRTTQYDNPDIEAFVRAGAKGVIAPSVNTAWQAEAFVKAVKSANPAALAIVMIETAQGVRNVEEIVRIPGVDVIHLGPYDLSLSLTAKLGRPIAMGSPEHQDAITRVEQAARDAKIPLGGASPSRSRSYALRDKGYQFITVVSDQEAVANGFKLLLGK